jgi:pyruvate carboxylase subunit B
MAKKIPFMCTAFRDGFQSVYGARVLTKDFLPALAAARDAGIDHFEAGGGARFQSLYFYCNEDAFDMMDQFRATAGPSANLQTLARGVNVVGLESQSSDIIRLHAELFKKHGITTIRNFDALNDVENLVYSGQCIAEAGLKHQVCVTLMELPPGCQGAHTSEFYIDRVRQILDADIPFDSICFKDASGTAVPSKVYDTVKQARQILPEGTFIHFHTHETAGISVQANLAALDAGADAIDLSLAPCSGGTCQPDILVMWHALRGSDYTLGIDIDKVREAEEVFKECMQEYFLPPEATTVEPLIPWSPMPGGALTANTQMMRDNGILDKYPDLIKAMGDVVRRGGFGTSVTPVSQFYIQQALNNIMFKPWEKIAPSYGKMILGYFGKTPVEPDPEIVKIASEQLNLEPTTRSPLEINNEDATKGTEAARAILESAGLPLSEENIFIAATCKEKGIAFLEGKATVGVRKVAPESATEPVASGNATGKYDLKINDRVFQIAVDGQRVTVNGKTFEVDLQSVSEGGATAATAPSTADVAVNASMPGVVLKILKQVGDHVNRGDTVIVLEAMKMEVTATAPAAGTIASIEVKQGDQLVNGQRLATIAG